MIYENPSKCRGFTISASAAERPKNGGWHGSYIIRDNDKMVDRASNAATFDNSYEAEQQAISLGIRIASGHLKDMQLPFKPRLMKDEYLVELNRQLALHPDYTPQMQLKSIPHEYPGMIGFASAGEPSPKLIYQIGAKVSAEYEIYKPD